MISVMWRGIGIPLIWTLLPTADNSDSETRACLHDRLRQVFPDLKIAALTGRSASQLAAPLPALSHRTIVGQICAKIHRSE
jgi:hypothetical protein